MIADIKIEIPFTANELAILYVLLDAACQVAPSDARVIIREKVGHAIDEMRAITGEV